MLEHIRILGRIAAEDVDLSDDLRGPCRHHQPIPAYPSQNAKKKKKSEPYPIRSWKAGARPGRKWKAEPREDWTGEETLTSGEREVQLKVISEEFFFFFEREGAPLGAVSSASTSRERGS